MVLWWIQILIPVSPRSFFPFSSGSSLKIFIYLLVTISPSSCPEIMYNSIFYKFPHCVLRSQVLILISPQFHSRNKEHTQIQLTLLGLKVFYIIKRHQDPFTEENWWPLSKKNSITSASASLRVRHHLRLKHSPENITIFTKTTYLYHYRLLLSSQTVLLAPQGQRQHASLQSDLVWPSFCSSHLKEMYHVRTHAWQSGGPKLSPFIYCWAHMLPTKDFVSIPPAVKYIMSYWRWNGWSQTSRFLSDGLKSL